MKLNNSIPSKKLMRKVSKSNRVKLFKTWKYNISENSKERLKFLIDKFKNKVLKPWTRESSSAEHKVSVTCLKRKRP